jgi:hypothetical protein
VRQAVPFQDLYRLDKMRRLLAFEVLLSAGVVSAALGLRSNLLHQSLMALAVFASIVAAFWIRWEIGRKRRRLAIGTVTRTLDLVRVSERLWFPHLAGGYLPRRLPLPDQARGFVVEVVALGKRLRYLDHTPRVQGESVLLLLDSKGNVLASAGSDSKVSLELLMKLA